MSARSVLLRMGLFVAGFLVLYVVAIRTEVGQRLDVSSFGDIDDLNQGWDGLAGTIRERLPPVLAVVVFALGVTAVLGRRWRDAFAAVLMVAVSAVAGQVLKDVLHRPYLGDFGYTYNTFPSGHTVVFASLVLAVVFLVPVRWRARPLGIALVVITIVCAGSSVVSFAHRPSDVVGGLLVVGAAAVPSAALAGSDLGLDWPSNTARLVGATAIGSVVLYVIAWTGALSAELGTVVGNIAPLAAITAATVLNFLVIDHGTAHERH